MRSFWIFVPVALLAFGPARVFAQQPDPAAAPQTQKPAQPAAADQDSPAPAVAPAAEKAPANNPDQSAAPAASAPENATNPFAPENRKSKVKSDNPFPTDDSPTAPLPRMESLPPADNASSGESGWSSSLDHADSTLSESGLQGDQSPPPITALDLEVRAKEDVRVGRYYASIGSWKGALGRFQSAYQNAKNDEDAVCGLAEAERHLGFSNEAILHYTECLHLDPSGAYARSAEKALRSLASHR